MEKIEHNMIQGGAAVHERDADVPFDGVCRVSTAVVECALSSVFDDTNDSFRETG